MAITSRLVGKFGGADVQKIPVDIVADGANGSVVVMHTVDVQEGETWLVVLDGDLDPNSQYGSGPVLSIGEVSIGPSLSRGHHSLVTEVTGTAEIALKRNNGFGTDLFVGHVYTAPMPD